MEPRNVNKILFQPFRLNRGDPLAVVIFGHFVGDGLSAGFAPVDDHPALGGAMVDSDGFHHPPARGSTVARTRLIHMFAPETIGTVIAIGAGLQWGNMCSAVLTEKGLLAGNESHALILHEHLSSFPSPEYFLYP